jgi:glutaredoxin
VPDLTPEITMVRAPACHFCEDAQAALAEVGADHPVRVVFLDAAAGRGGELVRTHRPAMLPLVLVDGAFFSQGRLPVRKLRALLRGRAAGAGSVCAA